MFRSQDDVQTECRVHVHCPYQTWLLESSGEGASSLYHRVENKVEQTMET